MALTMGSGPFGRRSAGACNCTVDAPVHQLYLEPPAARVRVVVDGTVVADSAAAMLAVDDAQLEVVHGRGPFSLPRA